MSIRRVIAGAAALVAALALTGLLAIGASAATVQGSPSSGLDSGGSTTSVTTSRDVLVGSPTSAASTTTVVSAGVSGSSSGISSSSVNYKIWAVVGALVLVALLIAWWTVHYWRITSPRRQSDSRRSDRSSKRDKSGEAPPDSREVGRRNDRDGPRRRSRYSDLVITVPDPDDHER